MDADLFRLSIIVLGVLGLLGIYLWERRKRQRRGPSGQRREPGLGPASEEDPLLKESLEELGDLIRAEARPRAHIRGPEPTQPGRAGEPDAEPAPAPDLPTLILQIIVAAKDEPFEGPDIRRVMEGLDMRPGDMHIYHRRAGKEPGSPTLFSLASLVNPGTFPFQAMEDFVTPGLVLFSQLPGPQDGQAILDQMLHTAAEIATQLGGELHDETHSVLTKQRVEYWRSEILEHRRRLQLAKSRPR